MSFQIITSGQPVRDHLNRSDWLGYRVQTAANQKLVIRLDGPDDADFDLYVKYGEAVTRRDYDFKRITRYADEALTIGPTQAGEYFILVYAFRGAGDFTLDVDTVGEEVVLLPGQQVAGEIGHSKGSLFFRVPMDAGKRLILDLNGPLDVDFDLYLRFGQRPTNTLYDQRSYSGSSKEKIEVENTQQGEYFVMVHAYRGTGHFTLGAGSGKRPTVLIITSKGNLTAKYGATRYLDIEEKIQAYAESAERMGHKAVIFYVDDMDSLSPYGLNGVDPRDAGAIKKLLDDVDLTLHIDNYLIVGGHDIIPFHVLPNPCPGDDDPCVYSDNPYASRDADNLVPERALTRLPDDAATDGEFFIAVLEQVIRRARRSSHTAFGLSAKVWAGASARVYKEIESTNDVWLSPPVTGEEIEDDWINHIVYHYFNLHGSEETANWYGQEGRYHFPVAFAPGNLDTVGVDGAVVCCEACYGANIIDKQVNEALALSFLKKQAACFVGSTKIAYGPPEPPCTDADLIVIKFFARVKEGLPFGEAFLKAKEDFARESISSNGYLDKSEEKTLLEFVIFADPLARMEVHV